MTAHRATALFDATGGEVCAASVGSGKAWAAAARAAGAAAFVIDTSAVTSKDALLATVGNALRFPDYFRRNWDAFEECLSDLSWVTGKRVVIHMGPLDALSAADPASVDALTSIAQDAVATHAQHGRAVWVLIASATAPAGLRELKAPP